MAFWMAAAAGLAPTAAAAAVVAPTESEAVERRAPELRSRQNCGRRSGVPQRCVSACALHTNRLVAWKNPTFLSKHSEVGQSTRKQGTQDLAEMRSRRGTRYTRAMTEQQLKSQRRVRPWKGKKNDKRNGEPWTRAWEERKSNGEPGEDKKAESMMHKQRKEH